MQSIVKEINEWFLPKREYFESFAQNDILVEPWLKMEMLTLLELLKCGLVIDDFESDCMAAADKGKRKVDFRVVIEGEAYMCGIRAVCTSMVRTQRPLSHYFSGHKESLLADFRRLNDIRADADHRCLVVFAYPRPSRQHWRAAIESLPVDLVNWRCVTEVGRRNEHVFIGLCIG